MKKKVSVIHNGVFRSDEVLAIVFLKFFVNRGLIKGETTYVKLGVMIDIAISLAGISEYEKD